MGTGKPNDPGRWQLQRQDWSATTTSIVIGTESPPPSGVFRNGTLASSLHFFAPILHDFCLLGEASKFVAVSPTRFSALMITADQLSVQISGSPGEVVFVSVLLNGVVDEHKVDVGQDGH